MRRRFVTALILTAMAAPLLSGCIIIASERPSTRVVHTSSDDRG